MLFRSVLVEYLGGFTLQVCDAYLKMQSHLLELRILEAFPELRAENRHSGDLMRHVTRDVLTDYPEYLPLEVATLFRELLAASVN